MSYPFDPDWVVAPGATLKDWMESTGLPITFFGRYGIEEEKVRRIFSGKQKITPKLAQQLCNATLIGAPFWLALEHNFRVGLAAGKIWRP